MSRKRFKKAQKSGLETYCNTVSRNCLINRKKHPSPTSRRLKTAILRVLEPSDPVLASHFGRHFELSDSFSKHSGELGQEERPRLLRECAFVRGPSLRVYAGQRLQAAKRAPQRREPPLGLRAAPARGRTGITRAAIPGGPDGGLGQQPHAVGLRQGPGQPLQVPQVLLQVRTVPLLEAPLQPCQQLPRPLRRAYLLYQLFTPLVHRARLPIGYRQRRPRCCFLRRGMPEA